MTSDRKRALLWPGVGLLVGAVIGLPVGGAIAAARVEPGQVVCPAGASLVVSPGGSWSCGAATPTASPTVAPSPTTTSLPPSPSATTTVAPSPTTASPSASPGGLLTGCFDRLAACGYPTTASTGVPPFAVLTPYTGSTTIRVAGTVIENKSLPCLAIEAANVVIRNSKITGPCFYGIDMRSGSLTIERSEVNCVDGRGTGIAWAAFAARAVYIHDCENALEMGQGASVVDSYLSAREATAEGHGDDIQSQGGNDVVIRHTTFAGTNPITSSIITNPTLNSRWTIADNFLSSGAYTLYCSKQGTGWSVTGNRFYPARTGNPHSAAYGLTDACNDPARIVWSGNFRDDNLSAVGANA